MELRRYINERIEVFEQSMHIATIFNNSTLQMGVIVNSFVNGEVMQYSLFDNRMKQDAARKALYNIKDRYGKNTVRKGSELFNPHIMKDAIGFGSVKDLGDINGQVVNDYLLEEDDWEMS